MALDTLMGSVFRLEGLRVQIFFSRNEHYSKFQYKINCALLWCILVIDWSRTSMFGAVSPESFNSGIKRQVKIVKTISIL